MSIVAIPNSLQNPKSLVRDDAEIVGYLVSEVLPLEGDGLAEKREDCGCELGLGFVESIMSDVMVHDGPQSLDRVQMWAVCG